MGEPSAPRNEVDTFLQEHEAIDEAFFTNSSGAKSLARMLLGQFLFFDGESKIVARILETEAYPSGDEVYERKFQDKSKDIQAHLKMLRGGTLVAWRNYDPKDGGFFHLHKWGDLYITVGEEDTGDVVLIRSCAPIIGEDVIIERRNNLKSARSRTNMLVNPRMCAQGLGLVEEGNVEWLHSPKLYEAGGVQLLRGTLQPGEVISKGPRSLPPGWSALTLEGKDKLWRFGLTNTEEEYSYQKELA